MITDQNENKKVKFDLVYIKYFQENYRGNRCTFFLLLFHIGTSYMCLLAASLLLVFRFFPIIVVFFFLVTKLLWFLVCSIVDHRSLHTKTRHWVKPVTGF